MNLRPMLIVNGVLIAGMAAVSAWAWATIPEGTQLPMQINVHGNPVRYVDKTQFLVLMPATALAVTLLFWFLPRIDPRRANLEASAKFWSAGAILSVALLAYVHALLVLNATVLKIDLLSALVPALSVLFIGLGNYLGKTKSNWFGGVRTPWSMSSEYSWEQTHRWSGRMMVASGLAALVAWFFVDTKTAFIILIGLVLATSALSIVLSYIFWRADPERAANGTH
ncbi:MAG: SdpI family protein [Micropepsaceae bacterium]